MQFFYRVRDPRIPESDEEIEREMPALSAAVSGRATRASRRASSASSLASPLASPRGSPVPYGKKTVKVEPCDEKDARVSVPSPPETPQPPAKLTTQPPAGTVQPKPVTKLSNGLTSPAPSPAAPKLPLASPPAAGSPTASSPPKITLTISPSRGTVTSSTTELPKNNCPVPMKSPTTPASTPVATTKPATPAQPPAKKNGTPCAVPVAKDLTPIAPKTSFAATVTTRTANGGFVTVKNPIARAPNGLTMAAKNNSPAQKVCSSTPKSPTAMKLSAPVTMTPKQLTPITTSTGLKLKRLSNGLPVLAPKTELKAILPYPANQNASLQPKPAQVSNPLSSPNGQVSSPTETTKNNNLQLAKTVKPPLPSPVGNGKPAGSTSDNIDEQKKVETAKAILQLSMGFKRCNTPTDPTLHNRINKIVKGLEDEDAEDGKLVIKSEPASPVPSPRNSPVPREPIAETKESAPLPPTLPKVNGLTITPIDPPKRKTPAPPTVDEKRPKLTEAAVPKGPSAFKRPAESGLPSPAPAKVPKVDKIAESMLMRLQEKKPVEAQKESGFQQSVQTKTAPQQRPPTPKAQGTEPPTPAGNQTPVCKTVTNSMKTPSPLIQQQPTTSAAVHSHQSGKSLPPLQPKPPAQPQQSQQQKPPNQPMGKSGTAAQNSSQEKPSVQASQPKAPQQPPQQSKTQQPKQQQLNTMSAQSNPVSAQSKSVSVQSNPVPAQSKPVSAQLNSVSAQLKPVSTQLKSSGAQPNLQPKPAGNKQQAKQQANQQGKAGSVQQALQPKPAGNPQSKQQAKPVGPQQPQQPKPLQPLQPKPVQSQTSNQLQPTKVSPGVT